VCVTEAVEFVTEAAALAEETGVRRREAERWRAVRVRWVAAWCLSPLWKQKRPHEAAFFFFYSISSGYHVERIRPPKYFEGIKM
jgi:hypothetical protein